MSNFKDNSGLDVIKPKMTKEESDLLMRKFLEKGGKVQKLKPGYPINIGSLERSKKPQWTREDIKEGKTGATPKPDYSVYKPGSYHDFDVGGDKPPIWIKSGKEKNEV